MPEKKKKRKKLKAFYTNLEKQAENAEALSNVLALQNIGNYRRSFMTSLHSIYRYHDQVSLIFAVGMNYFDDEICVNRNGFFGKPLAGYVAARVSAHRGTITYNDTIVPYLPKKKRWEHDLLEAHNEPIPYLKPAPVCETCKPKDDCGKKNLVNFLSGTRALCKNNPTLYNELLGVLFADKVDEESAGLLREHILYTRGPSYKQFPCNEKQQAEWTKYIDAHCM